MVSAIETVAATPKRAAPTVAAIPPPEETLFSAPYSTAKKNEPNALANALKILRITNPKNLIYARHRAKDVQLFNRATCGILRFIGCVLFLHGLSAKKTCGCCVHCADATKQTEFVFSSL
jgi:hypothetical protein